MKKYLPIALIVVSACPGMYIARRAQLRFDNRLPRETASVRRIVSLAPSVTQTLFALGAGDKLVGVTRYCTCPPSARIARIGGFLDPNFEAIVRLKPDIVILTVGNQDTARKLNELGLRVLPVNQDTVSEIIDSVIEIGHAVGAEKSAERLVRDIRARIDKVKRRTRGLNRPSVLISIGRSLGGGAGEIYVEGRGNFYDEIISIAGGRNAYQGKIINIPCLSLEGIARLNPDIIIDLAPNNEAEDAGRRLDEWSAMSQVPAVKNRRVYTLSGDYVLVPGPRFVETLEDAARVIHPPVRVKDFEG